MDESCCTFFHEVSDVFTEIFDNQNAIYFSSYLPVLYVNVIHVWIMLRLGVFGQKFPRMNIVDDEENDGEN